MRLNATGKSAWIKDEKYRDSIINVIGKAIGDCMALENEFKGLRENLGRDVIVFCGSKYKNPFYYTISNWNAVYLYNAVNLAINNKDYWEGRDFTVENIMEECHRRIKDYYEKAYQIYGEEGVIRLSSIEDQECIKNFLERQLQSAMKSIKPDDKKAEWYRQKVKSIEQLQQALNNFHENKGELKTLFDDAIAKLDEAKAYLPEPKFSVIYGDENDYQWIKDYLLKRRKIIACKELNKNLNQAKSNMIEYFEALHLDKILKDVYGLYSEDHPFSPAEQTKEKFKEKENRYDTFQYDILMNLNVTNTGKTDSECPIMQEIGYQPHFFIKNGHEWQGSGFYHGRVYEPINTIYIYGVSKLKRTKSEDPLYKNETETLESYEWKESDNYKELLKLLQGLVIPYGKRVVRI